MLTIYSEINAIYDYILEQEPIYNTALFECLFQYNGALMEKIDNDGSVSLEFLHSSTIKSENIDDRLNHIMASFLVDPWQTTSYMVKFGPLTGPYKNMNLFIQTILDDSLVKIISYPNFEEKNFKDHLNYQNLCIVHNFDKNYNELDNANLMLKKMASFSKTHDQKTHNHEIRVGKLSRIIAESLQDCKQDIQRSLNCKPEYLELLEVSARMHDVGKILIPSRVLNKKGPFNDNEKRIIKMHTYYGGLILDLLPGLELAKSINRYHAEKWDGSGTYGLKGERIPLASRIVLYADIFDALRSKRSYKQGYSYEKIYNMLFKGTTDKKGSLNNYFDPEILLFVKNNWDFITLFHSEILDQYPDV